MPDAITITLSAGEDVVTLNGDNVDGAIWCETLAGWWGTPEAKVELVERASGDGAHAVADSAILYAARVVQLGVVATGPTRERTVELMASINRLAHRHVTIEVDDGAEPTSATGYLQVTWAEEAYPGHQRGEVTITCADPRRYGALSQAYITPSGARTGGLLFDETSSYILYPIQFANEQSAGNTGIVTNSGTSTAYPRITIEGAFTGGVTITGDWGDLVYDAAIGVGAPVVLDSLTRTATVLGVDATRNLGARTFPTIEPGGSIELAVLASGTGTVTVEVANTYI